ncbi:MAG: c-type cytochrome biogenesis protein CcsB [Deltaproteobacteria bacterium RBG_16_54_11]|jgi:cytochrome c-type biogenesis protein CcsB|nr:MAG: c-type cytochrome biogenesis protein CcsB [Deltaproteobacteria bacterium RBG_16_54_11]
MNVLFFQVALVLYLGGTIAYLVYLLSSHERAAWAGRFLLGLGFISHCITLVLRYIEAGHTPVVNLHESLSFFAWMVVGFFLLLRYRYKVEIVGAFVSPLALLLVIGAAALPKKILPLPPALGSWWLPIHVTFAFLGDAIFALAFCAGLIYLIQERLVKSKRVGALSGRLPSLEVLDEINYRALTIGFPLLTIGIVTGAVWAEYAWGSYWSWDPKETWSLITWLLYAALLHQRLMAGWRGKKAAIMAIVGFGAVLFTFLGVNLLMEGLHTYAE